MRLDFRVLVVDDKLVGDRRAQANAVRALRKYLDDRGFTLSPTWPSSVSMDALDALADAEGREFDLVAVDYRLGQKHTGADVLRSFRRKMKYTEMVFYSADPEADLLRALWGARVQGVFVAQRRSLSRVLRAVADVVIGKVVDLSQMRGIVMAEVAELEVQMTDTIVRALNGREGARSREIIVEVIRDLMEKRKGGSQAIGEALDRDRGRSVLDVVEDSHIFSAHWKWEGVKGLAMELPPNLRDDRKVVKRFGREILAKRNILAHAREEVEDGEPVLRSHGGRPGRREVIDEEWMRQMRLRLRDHRRAMEAVCGAIVAKFGGGTKGEESKS